jgi:hypothetical protein
VLLAVTGWPLCSEPADDAAPRRDAAREQRLRHVAERDDRRVGPAVRVGQEDHAVVDIEQVLRMACDAVHQRRQVERRRDVAADLDQRGGLAPTVLRLVEQARVLEGDAHARRHRAQHADVDLAVRVLAHVVLEHDDAEHAVAAEDRHEHHRLALVGARNRDQAERTRLGRCVHDDRLARLQHRLPRAALDRRVGGRVDPLAVLVFVEKAHQPGLLVPPADADVAHAEDLAQLVADDVDDGLEVELGADAALDRMDQRELGVALRQLLAQGGLGPGSATRAFRRRHALDRSPRERVLLRHGHEGARRRGRGAAPGGPVNAIGTCRSGSPPPM